MNPPEADPQLPEAATTATTDSADGEPAAKPRRRRAPRKALAPDPAAPASPSAPSGDSPAAAVGADVAASTAAADRPVPDASAPPAAAAEGAADAVAEGAAEGAADGPDTDSGRSGSRRNRNRRRGRRGGDRARDGAEGTEGPAPGDAAAPAAPALADTAPLAEALFAQVLSGAYDEDATPAEAPEATAPAQVVVPADAAAPDRAAEDALAPAPSDGADAAEGGPAGETAPGAGAGESPPERTAAASRRVLAPETDAPKLQKVLAQAGVGSRRDLESMITEGRVTVNGEVAHIGQRISYGDRIQVDGKPVRYRIAPPPPRVLAYHKPVGEVVTHDDPQQRPTVFRRLPRLAQGKWQSVGRLDINTEGLLLFTNSGELANQLMHPRFGVEREYAVRSLGMLSEESQARLLEGVEIEGQRCGFRSIADGGGEGANHWYRVVITEGRNREVRKLFEAVGHAVSRLIRIRYGSVVLPRGLKRGVWVDLGENDVRLLRRLAGVPKAAEAPADGAPKRGRNRRGKGRAAERSADRAPDRAPDRGPRPSRPDRPDRPERGPRAERAPRAARGEAGDEGFIPNPLQQTFDKRALQQDRRRREMPEDGPIPNPLQQTFDKRALQQARMPRREIPEDGPIPNPLQQTFDKRFVHGAKGDRQPLADPEHIPDPMMTSVGYIGADAFHRKAAGGRRGVGKGGGKPGGPKGPGKGGNGAPRGPRRGR